MAAEKIAPGRSLHIQKMRVRLCGRPAFALSEPHVFLYEYPVMKKGSGEYDIVAVNREAVLVIEVKNKLQNRMVDNFVENKLPRFKKIFPEYQGRRLFGGMGALVVKDSVGRYAERAGLYVLTQTIAGGASLTNRKNFQAKEFS